MTVAHDAATESHTGTTGSASQASFSWTHTPVGTPRGVVVFVITNANAADITSVTYGGVTMGAVPGGEAIDTATEPGRCTAYFLGAAIPTGAQTVVVNRANNADVMYAVAFTLTAAANTEVVGTPVLLQDDGTLAEQAVNSGSAVAIRYAGINSGLASPPSAGASSTIGPAIDFGTRGAATARETTPGSGSRSVGFSSATSDDRAAVHLAIAEISALTQVALAATSTLTSSLSEGFIAVRSLAATSTFSPSIGKLIGKILAVGSTFSTSLSKRMYVTFAVSSTFGVELRKGFFISMAAVSTFAAGLADSFVAVRTLAVSGGSWVGSLATNFIAGAGAQVKAWAMTLLGVGRK